MTTNWHMTKKTPDYAEEIRATGFPLEYAMGSLLQENGWSVIGNKYYIDDQTGAAREIDIVAYKCRKLDGVTVYTTIIVSCKKSAQHTWALLSRQRNPKDPNIDWHPVHAWSNVPALDYELRLNDFPMQLRRAATDAGASQVLAEPSADVFAFQLMSKESGSPQNDRAIFDSVTSLMKAQAYELQSLSRRKKEPAFYQFNLASLVDGELIRLDFSASGIVAFPVPTEHYIARYIIGEREQFSRIIFARHVAFATLLQDYSRLHEANCGLAVRAIENFYRQAAGDYSRLKHLEPAFWGRAKWAVQWALERHGAREFTSESFSLSPAVGGLGVRVCVPATPEVVAKLNSDDVARGDIARHLQAVYRYSGPSEFEPDIPF